MAPKVCVPADFGRHHIGVPSHGNLTFNLAEGVQIRANSIILSLNSPVIDDLTTNLQLTSLEAEDFTREAVDCFIEACYTGETELLNKTNFRDVNKMSHVFKVSWLIAKCKDFFVSYIDTLNSESKYSDLEFAVDEAAYLVSALKKRSFLNMVVNRMSFISCSTRASFIRIYVNLNDLSHTMKHRIDACIAIVKLDVHVLVDLLTSHLEKQGNIRLDENTRYLLKSIDLSACYDERPELHSKLYSMLASLQCVGKEDFQLLLAITKQLTSQPSRQTFSNPITQIVSPAKNMRNNFQLSDFMKMLVDNQSIKNVYMFVDVLWCRLYQFGQPIPPHLLSDIVEVKKRNAWASLDMKYLDELYEDRYSASKLIFDLKSCKRLVSSSESLTKVVIFDYESPDDFVEAMFIQGSSIKFKIPTPVHTDKEFVLRTTPMRGSDPETFTMKYGLFHSDNETNIQDIPKLHFAIEKMDVSKFSTCLLPISWCGKPTCDKTKTYWNWGYIKFHIWDFNKLDMVLGKRGPRNLKRYVSVVDNCQVRLVAFLLS